jgi:hypothetical protein
MTNQPNATGHTPEPWGETQHPEAFPFRIVPVDCCGNARSDGPIGDVWKDADRQRIVQCVNALAGIPDPAAFVARARGQEAAIAELQEMVNVCEMDRNRALAQAAAAVQAERERCIALIDERIKTAMSVTDLPSLPTAAKVAAALLSVRTRIESGETP